MCALINIIILNIQFLSIHYHNKHRTKYMNLNKHAILIIIQSKDIIIETYLLI